MSPELDVDAFPATFAQQRLFFIDRLDPGNPAYNVVAVAHRLRGAVDVARLRAALASLVERHETLRTTFAIDGRTLHQHVHPEGAIPLELVEPAEQGAAALDALLSGLATLRMDVVAGPLAHAYLVRLDAADHVLLVVLHHLIADGWSVAVLQRELAACYAAGGPAAELPVLPVQYGDFAIWQRKVFDDDSGRQALAWWCERLADPPPRFDLPMADPRPARPSFRGDRHEHVLPGPLAERVARFARARQMTPYTVLLSAYFAVLHRYSGRTDLLVGTPAAARPLPELEHLIGYFANTVLLRQRLGPATTGDELVAGVRDDVLDALSRLDTPFERIVEAVAPPRDAGANPLLQVLFALHNFDRPPLRLPGLDVEPQPVAKTTTRFDLSLDLTEEGGALRCVWEYAADLLDRDRVSRLARHWERMLAALVDEPGRAIGDVDLLDEQERAELLRLETGPPGDPGDRALLDLFDEVAEQHADEPAVTCAGRTLTYRQLRESAWGVAEALAGAPGPVAICLPRGVDAIAAMLGVWYAGAAYLPLEPDHPVARRATVLTDAAAAVLVTTEDLAAGLGRELASRAAPVPRIVTMPAVRPRSTPPAAPPCDAAYLIYTSGSTGAPKGVAVRRAAVVNLVTGLRRIVGWTDRDTWSAVHSFAFDLSVWEIWAPLLTGGRLVVARGEEQRSVGALAGLLDRERVTMLSLTPSMLREVARSADPRLPGGLRAVFSGGEALPGDVAGQVLAWPVELWNLYGPTEATVWASACRVTAEQGARALVALGEPLPGTRLRVVDERLRPAPAGVPGELCIGGDGVADGYHGRPELTADRFVPDPLRPGERLYRTGDQAVRLVSGALDFLGRRDGQVKIRGHRVEVGEAEIVLRRQPGVRDAVVAAVRRGDHLELAGYVVADGPEPDTSALLTALRAGLPEYLVPASLSVVDRIPRTGNGKLDVAALPEPPAATAARHEAPRDELESDLAERWRRLLGVDPGIHDDFFALRGHSLLAMQLAAELSAAHGREISPSLVFQAPTVAALAAALRQGADTVAEEPMEDLFELLTADAVADPSIFGQRP